MIREVVIKRNNFLLIFSDAVLLYEAAEKCENSDLNSALAKSSILSVNFALEAAANSFMESVEISSSLKKKIDQFSTLEKFDFVLQWHTNQTLDAGDSEYQAVANLIRNRNEMVHPKVIKKSLSVETKIEQDGAIHHRESKPQSPRSHQKNPTHLGDDSELYTHHDAKLALQALTSFLNGFVIKWGIGLEAVESFLFQSWNGSIRARSVMFRPNQITALMRNDVFLNIQFMGIHGLVNEDGTYIRRNQD